MFRHWSHQMMLTIPTCRYYTYEAYYSEECGTALKMIVKIKLLSYTLCYNND